MCTSDKKITCIYGYLSGWDPYKEACCRTKKSVINEMALIAFKKGEFCGSVPYPVRPTIVLKYIKQTNLVQYDIFLLCKMHNKLLAYTQTVKIIT